MEPDDPESDIYEGPWKGIPPGFFNRSYRLFFCVMADDVEMLNDQLSSVSKIIAEERHRFSNAPCVAGITIHLPGEKLPEFWSATLSHPVIANDHHSIVTKIDFRSDIRIIKKLRIEGKRGIGH